MNNARGLLLAITSLIVSNVVSFNVLMRNLSAGIYPPEADSISIPLFENAVLSVLIFSFLAVASFLKKEKLSNIIISIVLCSMAALLSFGSILEWAIPNHYEMAAANVLVFAVCIVLVVRYARRPASNPAVHADSAPAALRR